jgi:hypothetical protein
MPEPNAPVPDPPEDDAGLDLQFEEAEYETPPAAVVTCGACNRPIPDAYYEINGRVVCASCRQLIEASFRGGSRVARVLKALVLGSLGALAGAALYYAIVRATGYNIGLVAVVVGLLVGGAVRKGSGNRGGRFYQFLALFLTYFAIVAMHVPMVMEDLANEGRDQDQPAAVAPEKVATEQPKAGEGPQAAAGAPKQPGPPNDAKEEGKQDRAGMNPAENKRPVKVAVVLVVALFVFAAIPIIVGAHQPISGLIYAFALWEAWKINKGAKLAFSGPFQVKAADPGAPGPEVIDDGG